MTQRSFFWNGAITGDADTYTRGGGYQLGDSDYASPLVDITFRMLFNSDENRGVLKGWLNELAVTGVATPVQVDTGGALVYGMPYENTVAVNVVVPNPTNDTRYDTIVLRRDWAAQTIRITRIAGAEGGSVPAPTQSAAPDGSGFYDIPLASFSVTTGGVIAVVDLREYITFCTAAVADSIVTASIVNSGVDFQQRAITSKSLRFGGDDLLPFVSNFGYAIGSDEVQDYRTPSVAATWGAAAATVESWICTGTGTGQDRGFFVAFRVPADFVPGLALAPRLWLVDDWAGASSYVLYSAWQAYRDGTQVIYSGGFSSESASYTSVVDTAVVFPLRSVNGVQAGDMILYYVEYYNSGGAESLLAASLEIIYGAYT